MPACDDRPVTDAKPDTRPAPRLRAVHTAAWVLAGAASVGFGQYVGGTNSTAYEAEWTVTLFSVVAVIGGIVLIAQARQRPRTTRTGRIAGALVSAVGLPAGAVIPIKQTCLAEEAA